MLLFCLYGTAVPPTYGAAPAKPLPWETMPWMTLPWEDSTSFRQALEKAGTPIRMAAYSATLKDPLPGELFNVSHAADILAGTVIKPGATFSQNLALGPYTTAKGYRIGPTYSGGMIVTTIGGGVCKIASIMYNVIRLSNLQVIERSNHSLTVPYVPPGQDATVYYGSRDFKFRNNTSGPVMLWAQTKGNTLYMALYGQQLPPQVTWHHQTLKHLPTWTIYRFNPTLPPGTKKVVAPGQDGIIVRTWITIKHFDGRPETKNLGRDYYSPSPQIIEKGPGK
jgi:vancomycin resistance protein VanW